MSKPATAAALRAMASVTFKRSTRGLLPGIAFVIAALPVLAESALRAHGDSALPLVQLALVILPPMFVAASIGDELDDRTAAYLWSRPLPRWTIVAGKLLALAPLCALFVAGSALAAGFAGDAVLRAPAAVAGLAAGALAACATVAGIAALLPRHAMVFALLYRLLDLLAGQLGGSAHVASIAHATRVLAGQEASSATDVVVALVVIPAVWLAIAFRRVRRLEA